jgi:hypothetical protein
MFYVHKNSRHQCQWTRPASFVCTDDFGQPKFQVLPAKEFITQEYSTWPAGTWVTIKQAENLFNEDTMGQTGEVVEPPAEFEYATDYGQMAYEQPMLKFLPAEEIITYEYDYGTWPAGIWVPTLHRDNSFYGDMWDKCCQDTFSIHQNLCG